MDDARTAWIDVANKVESLGLKLKYHLEQEADTSVAEPTPGTTADAFEELSGRVRDAFDGFGNATRDEAVHADVREIAELIKEALVETFEAVGAEISQIIEQIDDYAEDAAEKIADAVGLDVDLDDDDDDDDDDDRGEVPAVGASGSDDPIILESDAQDGDSA